MVSIPRGQNLRNPGDIDNNFRLIYLTSKNMLESMDTFSARNSNDSRLEKWNEWVSKSFVSFMKLDDIHRSRYGSRSQYYEPTLNNIRTVLGVVNNELLYRQFVLVN